MINCKQEIARLLKPLIDMDPSRIEELLEIPPARRWGIWRFLVLFFLL